MTTSDYYIDGIDLCSLQCPNGILPDFEATARAGFEFVYIKASQYTSTRDDKFPLLVKAAKAAGLTVGAYHFCSQSHIGLNGAWQMTDPAVQMKFFFDTCEGLGSNPGELPPMIDWEFCTKPAPSQCVDWLDRAARAATELWYPLNDSEAAREQGWKKRFPVIYTYPDFARRHQPALGNSTPLSEFPLCFASYKSKGPKLVPWYPANGEAPIHKIPSPWERALLVQYSGNNGLPVPGVTGYCDRQVFTGTGEDWEGFVGR